MNLIKIFALLIILLLGGLLFVLMVKMKNQDSKIELQLNKENKTMKKTSISLPGGDQWEKVYGFSRAKVIEDPITGTMQVYISNTSAFNSSGKIEEPENVGSQVEQIIMNMKKVMELAGGNLNDIVETTFYTTSFDFFPEIAHVHHKYFGEVQPATTLIHVSEMASSEMLVEGSARAIIYNNN